MSRPVGANLSAAGPLGRRGAVVLLCALAALAGAVVLDLGPAGLVPSGGGLTVAREFLAAALSPALDYEAAPASGAAGDFRLRVLAALGKTLSFAAAGLSLALLLALPLGCLASSAWWSEELGRGSASRWVQGGARALMAGMRSVHELLYAVIFLAALGTSPSTAVLAIAIPYGGTLAKVFADMLDEAPVDSAFALRAAGVAPAGIFLFGTLPRALPDMAAYAFYRLECAVRSSAVLGFFGFETLGYYLRLSFENLHYREVWTYLYALIALVLLLEGWSALMRRRFVA